MTDYDDALELVKMEALAYSRHARYIEEMRRTAGETAASLLTAVAQLEAAEKRLEAAIRVATAIKAR